MSVKKGKETITNDDVERFTSVFLVPRFICEGNRSQPAREDLLKVNGANRDVLIKGNIFVR